MLKLDGELFYLLGCLPLVDKDHRVDTCAVHVQHGLANVGRKRLADALPHLIGVPFTIFKQVVVLKADGTDAHALDLNEERRFLPCVHDAICMTEDMELLVADGYLSVLGERRATRWALGW